MLGLQKFQNESEDAETRQWKSQRIPSPNPPSNVWLYPDNCQIC